jgi:predicted phosphate transport protein (TIGR00153 family)
MPTTIKFGKLFAKSPFRPVRKHMRIASECVAFLPDTLQAFFRNDREALVESGQNVRDLSGDADALLVELRRRLPDARPFTLEWRDLFDVLDIQESIVRRMQHITGLLPDLPVEVPKDMRKPLLRQADLGVAATELANEIIKLIDKVVEAGFKGPHVEATRQLIQEVVVIETEADALSSEISRSLFMQCREMDPVAVVFLYQLIGWIHDLADFSEKLAIRSQLLLAR